MINDYIFAFIQNMFPAPLYQRDPFPEQHRKYKDITVTTAQVQEAIKQSDNNTMS